MISQSHTQNTISFAFCEEITANQTFNIMDKVSDWLRAKLLTWLPGTFMCAIRSLRALRRSCRRRCGALCTSWSISNDSSSELRACSHCHSSLKQHINHMRQSTYFCRYFSSIFVRLIQNSCVFLTHIKWPMIPTWTRCCCPEFWCDRGHWGVSGAPVLWSAPLMCTASSSPGIGQETTSSCSACDTPASPGNSRWTETE